MLGQFSDRVKSVFWVIWLLLPYILVTAATAVVLAFFNQTTELYRIFAQEPFENVRHIIMAVLTLALLTYVTWLLTRDTVKLSGEALPQWAGLSSTSRTVPALLAAMLPALASVGMSRAALEDPAIVDHGGLSHFEGLIDHTADLMIAGGVTAICAFAFLTAALLRSDRLDWPAFRRLARYKRFPMGLLLFALLAILIITWPLATPRFLGALATVLLFSLCLIIFIRFFYNFSPYLNAAFILTAAIWIFVLVRLDLNDYEVVPEMNAGPVLPKPLETAFREWLEKRQDRAHFADPSQNRMDKPPYPVFLVAASGGGLYSARHTAMTLARIQDNCPSFAQHVFAISGISGGSWGGAIFHSLARANAPNNPDISCEIGPGRSQPNRRIDEGSVKCFDGKFEHGKFERCTERFLEQDFLSPLIASGLFPNIFQFFWPSSVPWLNRSALFQTMIEESLRDGSVPSPIKDSVHNAWDAEKSGGALILNTTDADHGYQVVVAPFTVRSPRRQDPKAFMLAQSFMNNEASAGAEPDAWKQDLRISSGVAMSAGFPVFIGAGNLKNKAGQTLRLVDGGYYENSGVETLLQIIDQLREQEKKFEISLHVIILDSHYRTRLDALSLAPLKAILSTRSVRSQTAITNLYTNRTLTNDILVERCEAAAAKDTTPCKNPKVHLHDLLPVSCQKLEQSKHADFNNRFGRLRPAQISLDLETFDVPLAFALSHNANRVIDTYSGDTVCGQNPVKDSAGSEDDALTLIRNRLQCGIDMLCSGFTLFQP